MPICTVKASQPSCITLDATMGKAWLGPSRCGQCASLLSASCRHAQSHTHVRGMAAACDTACRVYTINLWQGAGNLQDLDSKGCSLQRGMSFGSDGSMQGGRLHLPLYSRLTMSVSKTQSRSEGCSIPTACAITPVHRVPSLHFTVVRIWTASGHEANFVTRSSGSARACWKENTTISKPCNVHEQGVDLAEC